MSSSRWITRGLPTAVVVGGLLALIILARPWLAGWDTLPVQRRDAAQQALNAAITGGAHNLAADELAEAEAALAAAHLELARQQARWLSFNRDYRRADAAYLAAAEAAERATAAATGRAAAAAAEARSLLVLADTLVTTTERAAEQMPFPRKARTALRQARTALLEGRLLLKQKHYDEAAAAARRSLTAAEASRDAAMPSAARFADADLLRTWRGWIDETITWSARKGKPAIVVYKEKRLLVLYDRGRAVGVYTADMGSNRLKQKSYAGDKATPEGRYHVVAKKKNGQTKYYKALLLDYPNAEDRARFARAKKEGRVPDGAGAGMHIEVHGHGGREQDWTLGCVALADGDIDEVFARVEVGTPVTIVGGDGKDGVFSSLWREHAAAGGR